MSDLSFHLVDRIDDLVPERSARGHLAIPADMSEFPACLVVEAIGQLAAWVAMQRASFERRPVAARAADVRVFGTVPPGARLELEISVQSCKSVAIAYEGEGRIGGKPVVELRGAAGAMLPMSEFDSPDAARAFRGASHHRARRASFPGTSGLRARRAVAGEDRRPHRGGVAGVPTGSALCRPLRPAPGLPGDPAARRAVAPRLRIAAGMVAVRRGRSATGQSAATGEGAILHGTVGLRLGRRRGSRGQPPRDRAERPCRR